jgi:hypothetical protein
MIKQQRYAMNKKIFERMMSIIDAELPANRRFKDLEEMSGIASHSWIAVSRSRQRPTAEMIEFVGRRWPDYAYWMVTGDTEPEFRHVAPSTYREQYPIFRGTKSETASAERSYRIALLDSMPSDEGERLVYIEKLKDTTFALKKDERFRLDFYAFEQHAKHLGSSAPDELFIVASDIELTKIKEQRWKEDKERWLIARNTLVNIQTGKWFEKKIDPLKKIINWLVK